MYYYNKNKWEPTRYWQFQKLLRKTKPCLTSAIVSLLQLNFGLPLLIFRLHSHLVRPHPGVCHPPVCGCVVMCRTADPHLWPIERGRSNKLWTLSTCACANGRPLTIASGLTVASGLTISAWLTIAAGLTISEPTDPPQSCWSTWSLGKIAVGTHQYFATIVFFNNNSYLFTQQSKGVASILDVTAYSKSWS